VPKWDGEAAVARQDAWIRWDRLDDKVIGVFLPGALESLRQALEWFRQVMVGRQRAYRMDDPTSAALGMPLPTRTVRYPPLRAAFALEFPQGTPDWMVLWWEPDVVRAWHNAAVTLLDSLPDEDYIVELDEDLIRAWKYTLPLLWTAFGVNLGVVDLPDGTTEEDMRLMPASYQPGGTPGHRQFLEWLREILDNLDQLAPSATP